MAATETMTMRIEPDFKSRVARAAEAQGISVTEFVVEAAERRMAATCDVCGRSDRPTAGAGLSEAADAFFKKVRDERNMSQLAITTIGRGDRPVVYRARLNLQEESQGMLLMLVDFKQGRAPMTEELLIPRGLVTGWQEDAQTEGHHWHLLFHGYRNGNDAAIRYALSKRRPQVVTARLALEAICTYPGITDDGLRKKTGLFNISYAAGVLVQSGVVVLTTGNGFKSLYEDPDDALMEARRRGIDVDAYLL